jgi:predicted metalloprotease with PDZ domain
MLLLDVYIIDHSDGRSSLDDAMRAFWKRYQADPSRGMTEDECYALIEESTKVQVRDRLKSWLDGTVDLPYDEILGAVGLAVQSGPKTATAPSFGEKIPFAKVPPSAYVGWTLAEANGRIVVRAVDDGTPAASAGIGIDDEIVAVDGRRVGSVFQVDHYLGAAMGKGATLTAHCDGRVYTTTITPVPTPALRLVEIEKPSKRQTEMRDRWLRRSV